MNRTEYTKWLAEELRALDRLILEGERDRLSMYAYESRKKALLERLDTQMDEIEADIRQTRNVAPVALAEVHHG